MAQAPEAQSIASVTATTTTASVAHVYVGSGSHILAYSAAANGKLTAVPGSPFNYSLSLMGANGHYLFGFEPSSVIIESFSMAANGALKKAATLNTDKYWPLGDCPLTYWNGQGLRIDHSGTGLYNAAIPEDLYCYSTFQSYKINNSNGTLTYLGDTDKIFFGGPALGFLGNNEYAYSPNCVYPFGSNGNPEIVAFQRLSSGELITSTAGVAIPAAPANGSDSGYYCPAGAIATDPTNHVAMTFHAIDSNDGGNLWTGGHRDLHGRCKRKSDHNQHV